MGRVFNLQDMKIHHWTVLKRVENNKHGAAMWLCECDCENKTQRILTGSRLMEGRVKSCGCAYNFVFHGLSYTRIYKIYGGMIERCYNSNSPSFKNYGMRGINICEEWKNSFLSFYEWSIDNGYQDDLSIDRIDVDKGYEPSNCRWTTMVEQGNNRRNNTYIEINGVNKTVAQWAKENDISAELIHSRIKENKTGTDLIKPARVRTAAKKSGVKGIHWERNKWRVIFMINKKVIRLGSYESLDEAIKVKNNYLDKINWEK